MLMKNVSIVLRISSSAHHNNTTTTPTNTNRALYQIQFHHNVIIFFIYSDCSIFLYDVYQSISVIGFEWWFIFILYLYYKLKPTRDGFIKNTVRTFCSHGENFQVRMHKMIYLMVLKLIILIGRREKHAMSLRLGRYLIGYRFQSSQFF